MKHSELCDKAGQVLVEAKKLYNECDDFALAVVWLCSKAFDEIRAGNEEYCKQDITYIAEDFLREALAKLSLVELENDKIDDDTMYWFGYLICHWCIDEEITPTDLALTYDLVRIIQAYPALHTVSIKMAIDKIKKDIL